MHALQPRLVSGSPKAVLHDFVSDRLAADARNRRFARGINIRYHYQIGIVEGAAKLAPQRFCTRITVGLKHREHSFAASRSRSFQCRLNLGGMMCVIVDEQKALALIFDLKPAPRVLEFTKRSCDLFKRNSK